MEDKKEEENFVLRAFGGKIPVYAALGSAQFLFCLLYVAMKYAISQGFSPFIIPMIRTIPSIPVFYFFAIYKGEKDVFWKVDTKMTLVIAITGFVLNQHLSSIGSLFAPASDIGILMPLVPVFATLMSIWLGREIYSHVKAFAICLSVVGCTLIMVGEIYFNGVGANATNSLRIYGIMIYILNTFVNAVWVVTQKPFLERFPPVTMCFWGSVFGSVINTVIASFFMNHTNWYISSTAWIGIVYACIGGNSAQLLFTYAVNNLPSSISAMGVCLQPIFSSILGALILGETITFIHVIGGFIIVTALYLVQRARAEEEQLRSNSNILEEMDVPKLSKEAVYIES